jgi:hypothetical protein
MMAMKTAHLLLWTAIQMEFRAAVRMGTHTMRGQATIPPSLTLPKTSGKTGQTVTEVALEKGRRRRRRRRRIEVQHLI